MKSIRNILPYLIIYSFSFLHFSCNQLSEEAKIQKRHQKEREIVDAEVAKKELLLLTIQSYLSEISKSLENKVLLLDDNVNEKIYRITNRNEREFQTKMNIIPNEYLLTSTQIDSLNQILSQDSSTFIVGHLLIGVNHFYGCEVFFNLPDSLSYDDYGHDVGAKATYYFNLNEHNMNVEVHYHPNHKIKPDKTINFILFNQYYKLALTYESENK